MFLDLQKAIHSLEKKDVPSRAEELSQSFPGAHIIAVGGFPIRKLKSNHYWCGTPISSTGVEALFRSGLGTSALMTYMDRSNKGEDGLADICATRGHLWGERWMTISLLLCGFGAEAELAFSRDSRFQLSWVVGAELGKAFVVNGTVRSWRKFMEKHEDASFHPAARQAMFAAAQILWPVFPCDVQGYFLEDLTTHNRVVERLPVKGKKVLEIGAGHGELTELILKQGPEEVWAYERQKGIRQVSGKNLRWLEKDFRIDQKENFQSFCLISNPPYSLLPCIKRVIEKNNIEDVLLLCPPKYFHLFQGNMAIEATLDGSSFNPPAKGEHYILKRGFHE